MRNYLLLTILIVVALFALWLQQDMDKKPTSDEAMETQLPDYFMENFTTVSLDKKGQIDYTLHATKMLYHDKKQRAELEAPHLIYNEPDKTVSLSASRAVFFEQKNLLHLYDDVTIQRTSATQTELSIHTDYMMVNTEKRVYQTEKPVKIVTPEAVINSRGLIYHDRNGVLTLTSEVKGVYETSQ